MLAAHALMGISIRNPLFSSDRLCMAGVFVNIYAEQVTGRIAYELDNFNCEP